MNDTPTLWAVIYGALKKPYRCGAYISLKTGVNLPEVFMDRFSNSSFATSMSLIIINLEDEDEIELMGPENW